ncbi:MAG: Sec-independent protein translocase protein TatB [Vibrio sp.]
MFDIGFWELVLISIVGLIVLGPERLPVAIRSVSQFFNGMKTMASNVKDELSQELKIQELQENLKKAENMGMNNLSPELKASVEELKQAAQSVQRPYEPNNSQTSADSAQSTSSNQSQPAQANVESVTTEKTPAQDDSTQSKSSEKQ